MNRPVDLSAETIRLRVPVGAENKVVGEWGAIVCDLVCRDCPAMLGYMEQNSAITDTSFEPIDVGVTVEDRTQDMMNTMNRANSGVLDGRPCNGPTKKFIVAGRSACHGTFYEG